MLRTTIIAIAIAASTITTAWALDQSGLDYGTQIGSGVKGQIGDKGSVDTKLQKPLTTNTPLSTMDNSQSATKSTFCGQGEVQSENKAIQVILDETGAISISTDTNGDGNFEATSNYTATKICIDGYQVGIGATAQYYQWTITAGAVDTIPLGITPLNGCMDPSSNTATYIGGSVAQKWADATGKVITNSSLKGNTATYYSGTVKDCAGVDKTPKATKYYDNPYTMNDAAIQQSIVCTMNSTDPACQAYAGTRAGLTNVTGQSQTSGNCTIERTVQDSTTNNSAVICEANRIYYPSPYTNAAPTCYKSTANPPDRWDYNQQFRFKCDPYGKQLNLEAWAWWEGTPCGSGAEKANYPPPYQLTYNMPWGGTSTVDTVIGELSVNRRGADNITYVDVSSDTVCYSTTNPLKVHMTSYVCPVATLNCIYNFTVENSPAPGCQTISYTHVQPPEENVTDGCSSYENDQNCSIKDEIWYDATGTNYVQTIKDGASTNNQLQVYDASSPYNPLPTTCKTFNNVGQVCKDWWRKDRTYKCEGSYKKIQPNMTRAEQVMDTSKDNDNPNFSYQKSVYDKENTPKCILEVKYTSGDIPNCYTDGLSIKCPIKYDFNTADNVCTRDPNCSPYEYVVANNRCQYDPGPTPICDPAYTEYDVASNKCRGDALCYKGTFIPATNRCEMDSTPSCISQQYTYDGTSKCILDPPPCTTNYTYDASTKRCEPTAALCPVGVYTPPPSASCTADYTPCNPDTYDPATGNCYHTAGLTCYATYQPDVGNNVCFRDGECAYGYWNASIGKCSGNKEYLCNPGYNLQAGNICTDIPTCPEHNNKTVDYLGGCKTTRDIACTLPYAPNNNMTLCAATPTCPGNGTYVPAHERCEITTSDNYKCDAKPTNNYSTMGLCQADCYTQQNCQPAAPGSCYFTPITNVTWRPPQTITVSTTANTISVPGGTANLAGFTAIPGTCTVSSANDFAIYGVGNTLQFSTGCTLTFQDVIFTGAIYNWTEYDFYGDIYPMGSFRYRGQLANWMWNNTGDSDDGYADWSAGTIYLASPTLVCPLGNYPCSNDATPKCTKLGICNPSPTCIAPYVADGMTCVTSASCPDGQAINNDTKMCEKTPTYVCYPPYTDNGSQCEATAFCNYSAPIVADKCTMDATFDCKSPSTWNATDGLCELNATCPNGGNIVNNRCETPFIPDCPAPYLADATGTKCVVPVTCPIGTFDITAQKCIMNFSSPSPNCPDGGMFESNMDRCVMSPSLCTTGMYYDNTKCWMDATCPTKGKLDPALHKCTYTPDICQKNWLYDTMAHLCYKDPTCPSGTMNFIKDRCEAPPACEKVTYPEMDCLYNVPATKTGLHCMSTDPIPDCATPLTCPQAGALNGNICNAPPVYNCTNPYAVNGSMCTAPAICPQSTQQITVHYDTGTCTTPKMITSCPSGYSTYNEFCKATSDPCQPGTYNPTTGKCEYTPDALYRCSPTSTPYMNQIDCNNNCYQTFSTSGTGFHPCVNHTYTLNASGNTISLTSSIDNLQITLNGFTATSAPITLTTCLGCPGTNVQITPNNSDPTNTQFNVLQDGTIKGVIQLNGGAMHYEGMTMTLRNGSECSVADENIVSFGTPNGNTCVRENDSIDAWNSQFCIQMKHGTCQTYTSCPDSSWEKNGTMCQKTPICTYGGIMAQGNNNGTTFWYCQVVPDYTCSPGYGIISGLCTANGTCPLTGGFDNTYSACTMAPEPSCPSTDYTPDQNGNCIASAQCPTGAKPTGGTEVSRRIYQNCSDPNQCSAPGTPLKCSVKLNTDGSIVVRDCTNNGNDSYACPSTDGVIDKDCACVTETWNSALTDNNCTYYKEFTNSTNKTYIARCLYDVAGCQADPTTCISGKPYKCTPASPSDTATGWADEICCEPSCTVTLALTTPEAESNVMKDYTVKSCAYYNGSANAYTCPVTGNEQPMTNGACRCTDHFGITAAIMSGVVESAKDRVCEP